MSAMGAHAWFQAEKKYTLNKLHAKKKSSVLFVDYVHTNFHHDFANSLRFDHPDENGHDNQISGLF